MMQQIVVLLIVAAAAVHLGRYLWRSVKNVFRPATETGCAACGTCAFAPLQSSTPQSNFISLDQIRVN